MLVSLAKQINALNRGSIQEKCAAVRDFGVLRWKGREGALGLLHQCLEGRQSAEVRAEALKAIASFVEQGDENGITLARKCLRDSDKRVRAAATALLACTTLEDDIINGLLIKQSIDSLCQCLCEDAVDVRMATVKALQYLKGNKLAISSVKQHLENTKDWGPGRCSGIQGLAQLSEKGDESTIATLKELLNYGSDQNVKCAAGNALYHLTKDC